MPAAGPFSSFGVVGFFLGSQGDLWCRISTALASCVICSASFSAAFAAAQTWIGPRIKFPSFLASVLPYAAMMLLVLLAGMGIGVSFSVALAATTSPWDSRVLAIVGSILSVKSVGIAFCTMVAVTFYYMLRRKLGPGVLENWMLGRYYRPREEERVFMFLALRDFTRLGEQLGDMKFSRLIQQFFADLSEPALKTKGEVSHSIGDEAVLTWKRSVVT